MEQSSRIYNYLFIISILPVLVLMMLVHEIGHIIIATLDQVNYTLITRWTFLAIVADEHQFSSLTSLLLFKGTGFIITFTPAFVLWRWLRSRSTRLWVLPTWWIIASPASAHHDFYDIGVAMGSVWLGIFMANLVVVTSIILFVYFIKVYQRANIWLFTW
jgi:hypothetical protein